jgi:hypothetical protein
MPHLGKSPQDMLHNAQDNTEESKRKAEAEAQEKADAAKIEQARREQEELKNKDILHGTGAVISNDVQTGKDAPAVDKIVPPGQLAQVQQQSQNKATTPLKTQPAGAVEEVKQHFNVQPSTDGHSVTVSVNTQGRFKWKAVCTCAWQGLFDTKDEAIERAKKHKDIRNTKVF